MHDPHDELFRAVFSIPEHAGPLLRCALPDELARAIDCATLAPAPASLLAGRPAGPNTEMLFTATLTATRAPVSLLLMRMSDPGPLAVLDVMDAALYVQQQQLAQRPADAGVPPLVAVVMHHGRRPWTGPTRLQDCLHLDSFPANVRAELERHLPDFRFLVIDLASSSEEELMRGQPRVLGWPCPPFDP